ncbi:hypothetical protein Glove_48g32 [Diversispora epigaea]|uniref:Uncharacterized protein n=1 Tax=Diversispora epigaea TaxID=1348612 RepID=A0A397JE96_9GLOM|nr:hypothetical protein Glove_48g32 [Diversispora epigaea]
MHKLLVFGIWDLGFRHLGFRHLDFEFERQYVEHTFISKFILHVATTNGKWGKIAFALSKDEISKGKSYWMRQNNYLSNSTTRQVRLWRSSLMGCWITCQNNHLSNSTCQQIEWKEVKLCWNKTELEKIETGTQLLEKELRYLLAHARRKLMFYFTEILIDFFNKVAQQVQATKNASNSLTLCI